MYQAQDGGFLFAGAFNALVKASEGTGVVNGCEVSLGSGTLDTTDTLSVASGEYLIDGDSVTFGGDSVGIDSHAEDGVRYVTVAANSTGDIVTRDGNVDTTDEPAPAAPNEADDEVLLAFVRVTDVVDELFDGRANPEIYPQALASGGEGSGIDADTFRGKTPGQLTSPVFGNGSDGEVVRSSSGSENGMILSERYEVQSGVTRSVTNGVLCVHATEEIIIDGTIDASAYGGAGGAGGSAGDGSGEQVEYWEGENGGGGVSGGNTDVVGVTSGNGVTTTFGNMEDGENGQSPSGGGAGGHGGDHNTADGGTGGPGGSSGLRDFTQRELDLLELYLSDPWKHIHDLSILGGAGGGGGGGGGEGGWDAANREIMAAGPGGDGGNGGGVVVLIAPSIVINGQVLADGEDGQDGQDAEPAGSFEVSSAGGGAGGGGNGGLICTITGSLTGGGILSASRGLGGVGGEDGHTVDSSDDGAGAGGDGGDGSNGIIISMGGSL